MTTAVLQRLRAVHELNIKHYKQTIQLNAFIVQEQKKAMEDLIICNETAIDIINQQIEAVRLGVKLT